MAEENPKDVEHVVPVIRQGEGMDNRVEIHRCRHQRHHDNGERQSWELVPYSPEIEKMGEQEWPGEEYDKRPHIEHLWYVETGNMVRLVTYLN